MDTIFALATPRGKSGVAVIRVSGPDARAISSGLCDVPRVRGVRRLVHKGEILDEALVLAFDAGRSFTGEETVEFQVHGSVAVIDGVLAALGDLGARVAEPGEFTRRALENDRLDLAQVEGLADLIESETEAQRKQAMALMQGKLSQAVEGWRADLIRAAALIEATIDFADEEVPEDVYPEVLELLGRVERGLAMEIAGSRVAERIRSGFEVAIVGPPNVGKSTLLNALAGREAAITSEIAGTTRDVIEVRMDLAGLPVTLLDTAGLRETDDRIEVIGVERAIERARAADLRIFLTETGEVEGPLQPLEEDLVLRAKADSGGGISGKTGAGIPEMVAQVAEILGQRAAAAGSAVRERHRLGMEAAVRYIQSARELIESGAPEEVVALEIRSATTSLEALVGRVGVEDLLDEIFASFCLGK